MEGILGIERRGKEITFRPKLPAHWEGYAATLKMFDGEIKLRVIRDKKTKSISLEVDGSKKKSASFEPKAGGKAEVVVRIPA